MKRKRLRWIFVQKKKSDINHVSRKARKSFAIPFLWNAHLKYEFRKVGKLNSLYECYRSSYSCENIDLDEKLAK